MTWGRARATRSSSQTWTSTRSRIWCGMSTVAGEKCERTFYLNFFGCRVSDLPDKSDLLLSAADKYDIRWSWMVNVVSFQSKTKNNYHPKYPPKTRERSPWKSLLAILLPIKAQFCFLCRDLKEECCQSLSANLAVDQVILFSCHDLGVQHKCDVKQMVFF